MGGPGCLVSFLPPTFTSDLAATESLHWVEFYLPIAYLGTGRGVDKLFSAKEPGSNTSGFASHMVSVATSHPCHCHSKAAADDTHMNGHGQVQDFIYKNRWGLDLALQP